MRQGSVDGGEHLLARFADGQSADGVAGQIHCDQPAGAAGAQIGEDAALDDAEKGLRRTVGALGSELEMALQAALGPAQGHLHRFPCVLASAGEGGALVEDHDDIGAQAVFDLHDLFGGEQVVRAVQVGLETDALFLNLVEFAQAEDLVAAAIGEDGTSPVHEAVQAAGPIDQLVAGTQVEVVGIAQNDAGVELFQILLGQGLDRGPGADRHEDRSLHRAVRGVEQAGASPGAAVLGDDFKGEGSGFG